jgi:hypothetical protein
VVRAATLLALLTAIVLMGGPSGAASAQGTPTSAAATPENLEPPAESVLLFALGARGVQIYTCAAKPEDSAAFVWTFKAPQAELFNARGEVVGSHFAGPTWQGQDGSAVVGKLVARADAPSKQAIPWLLLEAKSHAGGGAFSTITHIQRLDTKGGVAPSKGCDETHKREEARVPYEATYAFYYPAAS